MFTVQTQRIENANGSSKARTQVRYGRLIAVQGTRELEVLLALCRAAPLVYDLGHAERLLKQIGDYLPEAHLQTFKQSPHLKSFLPSPWELITREITSAILAIAINHKSLRALAFEYVQQTVEGLAVYSKQLASVGVHTSQELSESESQHAASSVRYSLCVLGLLSALSERARAFTAVERLRVIKELRAVLSEAFMTGLEGTLSSIRNSSSQSRPIRPWKRLLKSYAFEGRPIGAVLLQRALIQYIAAGTALFVGAISATCHGEVLDFLLAKSSPLSTAQSGCDNIMLEHLTSTVMDSVGYVDADVDFFQMGSVWQQRQAFSLKANALTSFLCCSLVNEDIADADILMGWLDHVIADQVQLADDELAQTALKCMAVLAKTSKTFASSLARSLPRLIVQSKMTPQTSAVAADSLAQVLLLLPQDMQISTLYSLGNVLSIGADPSRANPSMFFDGSAGSRHSLSNYTQQEQGSAISLVTSDAEETAIVHGTVVQSIVRIATRCNDERIIALAVSMLAQKFSRAPMAVDIKIIRDSAALGLRGSPNELRTLLRLYARSSEQGLRDGNGALVAAVLDARLTLAHGIRKGSALYEIYLTHLLDTIVSTTGIIQSDKRAIKDGILGAEEIGQVLPPLAVLVSVEPEKEITFEDPTVPSNLSRGAWFNLVAHDFTLNTGLTRRYSTELEILALHTPSLIDKDRADARESGIELNTVLKRNMNPAHTIQQKQVLTNAFPTLESEIKGLEYAELTFLNAAHLIAVLRARTGDCTRTMEYFFDAKLKTGGLSNVLFAIALSGVDTYLAKTRTGRSERFAAPQLANQLVIFLEGCCHRIAKVQQVATSAVDRIINTVPSALCHRSALFAMLELLGLLWNSCLEAETDEYEWKSSYTSTRGNVSVQLSDDFTFRRASLNAFHKRCRLWTTKVIDIAPLDMKGLLQTYLSEYDDEGAYGHVSLGRSFALEMGCLMPSDDQRLGSFSRRGDLDVNAGSDFMSQYTTRQEYRAIDNIANQDDIAVRLHNHVNSFGPEDLFQEAWDATEVLKELQSSIDAHDEVSPREVRIALRRAAAILCRVDFDHSALVHHLVAIPFAIFSKLSIKLGISLWTGVLWENAQLEPKILAEVIIGWESSMRKRRGIFNQNLQ